jgi:hypothetical protein
MATLRQTQISQYAVKTDAETKALIDEARRTNLERDAMDRKSGFAPPGHGPNDSLARTIICALHCGIRTEDWNAVAEGLVMLVDLEYRLRGGTGETFEFWEPKR